MLNIDQFFFKAIDNSSAITTLVAGRVFNTARDKDAETADKIPYIIVQYDGGTASGMTKDNEVAQLDQASVSILCCASDRSTLATLTEAVVTAIETAFASGDSFYETTWTFGIDDATPSANGVEMDVEKPCYFQTLTYQCNTYKR